MSGGRSFGVHGYSGNESGESGERGRRSPSSLSSALVGLTEDRVSMISTGVLIVRISGDVWCVNRCGGVAVVGSKV